MGQYRISFSGGGARFAALLAAAEGVEKCDRSHSLDFRIADLAGTSAGSIVACMLASEKPISEYRQLIAHRAESYIQRIAPFTSHSLKISTIKQFLAMVSVFRGKPLLNEEAFRDFLHDIFDIRDPGFSILSDLDIKGTRLLATDPINHDSYVASPSDRIVDAIVDSCALPFGFRTFNNRRDRIDGGLLENLPGSDIFERGAVDVPVIAFAFSSAAAAAPPKDFLSYGLNLLSCASRYSVRRTQRTMGSERICFLNTNIHWLDFDAALQFLKSREYHETKEQCVEFIKNFIATEEAALKSKSEPNINVRAAITSAWEYQRKIGRIYSAWHDSDSFEILKMSATLTLQSLLTTVANLEDEYSVEVILKPNKALKIFRIALAVGKDSPFEGLIEQSVRSESGEPIDHTTFPVQDVAGMGDLDKTARHLIFVFHEPVSPENGNIHIRIHSKRNSQLDGLRNSDGSDWVLHRSSQKELVPEIEIICLLPRNIGNVGLSHLGDHFEELRAEGREPKTVGVAELVRGNFFDASYLDSPNFRGYGWRASNVELGQAVGVLLSRTSARS